MDVCNDFALNEPIAYVGGMLSHKSILDRITYMSVEAAASTRMGAYSLKTLMNIGMVHMAITCKSMKL